MFKIQINTHDLSGGIPLSSNNIWINVIIEILTAGTLYRIKNKVVERNKIDLDRYQHEHSIAARIRKAIYHHSSECEINKGEQDLFYAVNGKYNECWGLRYYNNHKRLSFN